MDTLLVELIKDQKLVSLKPEYSVKDALTVFGINDITCAPIIEGKQVLGLLDALDLLAYLIRVASKPLASYWNLESKHLSTDDMETLMQRTEHFNLTNITDIINISKRNPYRTLKVNNSVRDAVEIMKDGIHRIGIINNDGELIGLLTQSMIIRHCVQLLCEKYNTIEEISNKREHIITIPPLTTAIDAFIRMHKENISSLAIIDDGKLVGTISATDLKELINFPFTRLLEYVVDYVTFIRKQQEKPFHHLVACNPSTPLKEAIQKLIQERVHRIYLVDQSLQSVVSLTDIIKSLSLRITSQ